MNTANASGVPAPVRDRGRCASAARVHGTLGYSDAMPAAPTPAVALLLQSKVVHRVHTYDHDPRSQFKTLVVKRSDNTLAVAVLPVTATLALKSAAAALGTRKLVMAERIEAERSTGYVFGGISPLGQKRQLPTVIDESALGWDRVLCSGGRRGLEIELDPRELVRLTRAVTAAVSTG
jgi:Cys-tRNA(Pro)/Cys-tRNA(Cys) deacylase